MRRLLAGAAIAAVCVGVLTVWLYPSRADFRPTNPYWNGLSDAAGEWRMTSLPSLDLLPRAPGGTAVVIIPYRPVGGADIMRIRRYLEDGGVVVLLDDFGTGNQILEGVGLSARFAGSPLLDPLFNYKNQRLPKIPYVFILPVGSAVILNHATALTKTSGMTVVAQSSRYSFLDRNGNGRADPSEPRGPFAVAGWTRVGRGVLFAASDPSFLINSMIGLGDNRRFARQVFRLAGEHPRIFLDEAHLPAEMLDRTKAVLQSARTAIGYPVALLTILLAGAVAPLAMMLRRWDTDAGLH